MSREQPNQGGRPQGQLERALVDQTVGMVLAQAKREQALEAGRSGEYDQQVEVAISGSVGNEWGYVDIAVSWEHPIVFVPLQRDPQFAQPHVSSHVEFTSGLPGLVIANVHVIDWLQSPEGWFIGAKVRVAMQAPLTDSTIAYSANVHLTFQGWAAPTDPEEDIVT